MKEKKWKQQESAGIWLPKEIDEELIGGVTGINTEGIYGNQYTVKKEDGNEILTPSHKVLQNRMSKVKVGDNIKIVFLGEEPPTVKGNNPTKMYEVYIEELD